VALVLFTHYRGWVPGGSIGVSIFFCLSGLLICRILIGLPELSPPNIVRLSSAALCGFGR
jgi:peptidoglycan/LPS O-acetylase OafA/YrhL